MRRSRATLIVVRSVRARYVHGSFEPEGPLALREGERVQLIIVRQSDPGRWDLARLAATGASDGALAAEGIDGWANELDREDHG